ncbi:uncharacterized protein LOC127881060 isoform X2 [Dreissena polymorpha]|uniref:uncharacterized protein LOC127881060 isoform X2 n=1 Tax=Dreissena polymorpha TaxID=45954 RepID=UPI0022653A43|nr:uncharacterized protein LOC127881060 isoform X2 [Dreissena polymorpha]XP_052284625.1 uncharacterized protein LOC127881060 isoform X2 [Dreissena polymorpha]XP_052284626.1 uncharacterized protein LOC127881060 isoform X2 [Dreissena polymorpha]XP_052284627.1 uncharacterized protein LOC127881060 isoform X2 [Dreissena polymorpha]
MVLLNLSASLKSLPLPFGRNPKRNRSSTDPCDTQQQNGLCNFLSASMGAASSQRPDRNRKRSAQSTPVSSVSENNDCAQSASSLTEALRNYSILGAHDLKNADNEGFNILPNKFNPLQSATLPRNGCPRLNHINGSVEKFDSEVPASVRVPKRSMSTIERPRGLRRKLIINPTWKAVPSREVRRARSFNVHSDAMSTEGDVNGTASPTASPTLRKRHKPLVVKRIPTKELVAKQTLAGYVERKGVSMQWMRYWFVLHEGTLFCYLTSTDDVTVDVLNLNGYSVTSLVDKFRGKRFVLQLSHEHFTPLQLSLETREEMEEWEACLGEATKQPSSRVPVGGPDSPTGACADCEGVREDEVDERRKQVKQKLLEEVLRQKYELERKQAERLRKQGRGAPESPDRASTPDMLTDDQRTSDVTRLRQRRMSTQLKVDTLSKQIEKPSSAKRSIFSFGKTKKLDENKNNVFLQDQLKELNEKLHKIDTDLSQVESETKFTDVNQNKKSNYSGNMTSQLMTSERTHDSDEDDGVRSKTLKSAVHKWTAKTFSVKRKQSSTSKHSVNGSLPNLSSTQNGDVDSCGDQESESDNTSEDFLQESVTDLTRPLADLKLNLDLPLTSSQAKNNGSESPSPLGPYNRSGSRTTLSSTLSSPRREIDPSVLAEIDAFEELTKQVLGARSKDVAVAK